MVLSSVPGKRSVTASMSPRPAKDDCATVLSHIRLQLSLRELEIAAARIAQERIPGFGAGIRANLLDERFFRRQSDSAWPQDALGGLPGSQRVPGIPDFPGTKRRHEAGLEVRDRHRAPEEIALPLLASEAQEKIGGGAILNAFRDHRKPELLAETDGRTDNRGIVGVGQEIANE